MTIVICVEIGPIGGPIGHVAIEKQKSKLYPVFFKSSLLCSIFFTSVNHLFPVVSLKCRGPNAIGEEIMIMEF